MEFAPSGSADVVNVAWPVLSRLEDPSVADPFLNVTGPVGRPLPGAFAVTAAVKVTGWPETEGLGEEVRVVVVPSLLTDWLSAPEMLPLKLPSPLYEAVIEADPAESVERVSTAWRAPFRGEVP